MDVNIELYHDNFQNFKRYNIPKAQLVIADIPITSGLMLMQAIRCGIRAATTKMVKAHWQNPASFIPMVLSKSRNICTFATAFFGKNRKKRDRPRQ